MLDSELPSLRAGAAKPRHHVGFGIEKALGGEKGVPVKIHAVIEWVQNGRLEFIAGLGGRQAGEIDLHSRNAPFSQLVNETLFAPGH